LLNSHILLAKKTDKKSILRFYKSQHYSARFIGLDYCYLVKKDEKIIASVMVSQITTDNSQYFLHALVVDKNHQKQGIATKLVNHVNQTHQPVVCFAQPELSRFYHQCKMPELAIHLLTSQLNEHLSLRFQQYQKKQSDLKVFISLGKDDKN